MSINNIVSTIAAGESLQIQDAVIDVSSSYLAQASGYFTGADIRGMHASPILMIGPTTGSSIVMLDRAYLVGYASDVSTVFTGGGDVYFQYGNGSAVNALASAKMPNATFLSFGEDNYLYQINGGPSSNSSDLTFYSPFYGTPIYLTNDTASFVDGENFILLVKMWYRIFEITI